MIRYRHKKTGHIYLHLAVATDATSDQWRVVVVYCPDDNEYSIYVREQGEFEAEFEMVDA